VPGHHGAPIELPINKYIYIFIWGQEEKFTIIGISGMIPLVGAVWVRVIGVRIALIWWQYIEVRIWVGVLLHTLYDMNYMYNTLHPHNLRG
jgi:hypothetical protein